MVIWHDILLISHIKYQKQPKTKFEKLRIDRYNSANTTNGANRKHYNVQYNFCHGISCSITLSYSKSAKNPVLFEFSTGFGL